MQENKSGKLKVTIMIVILSVLTGILLYGFIKNNKTSQYIYKRSFGTFDFETVIRGNMWKNKVEEIENIVIFPLSGKEPDEKAKEAIIKNQQDMDKDIISIKGAKYNIEFLPGKIKKTFIIPLDSTENINSCIKLGIIDADKDEKSINLKETIKAMDSDKEWTKAD